jgi:hypothetical protein
MISLNLNLQKKKLKIIKKKRKNTQVIYSIMLFYLSGVKMYYWYEILLCRDWLIMEEIAFRIQLYQCCYSPKSPTLIVL